MENEAPETSRVKPQPGGSRVFHEVDKHPLAVCDAAAALAQAEANSKARSNDAFPPRPHEITVLTQNDRWDSREFWGFDRQFFVVTTALLIVLGLGFGGWKLYRSLSQSGELSGTTAVSALVERSLRLNRMAIRTQKTAAPAHWVSVNFSMKPGLT